MRRDLPPSQTNSTSDDYTDMTWHAPTSRFYVARPALKAPPGYAYPTWAMNALGGVPATIDPMVLCAAKTVALTALRLFEDTSTREAAWREFQKRSTGADAIPPLCDYEAPVDLRWPEYVTTPRGREWWIPTRESEKGESDEPAHTV
jgi:aminobenzoyl-glutamate utilization protein B